MEDAGLQLALSTAGVVVALTFVAAPFYLRQAQAAFAAVDGTQVDAARTLGSQTPGVRQRGLAGAAYGIALGEWLHLQRDLK